MGDAVGVGLGEREDVDPTIIVIAVEGTSSDW